ncbi:MAG: hypothetical protein BWZ09_01121 [Alphaproteobacteria bacterium ADurb.BinA305]|nr:MAG: hypothetical protein BWZ09_01121 [Alphaproteobacteria bacterium ADurb.BinA305]
MEPVPIRRVGAGDRHRLVDRRAPPPGQQAQREGGLGGLLRTVVRRCQRTQQGVLAQRGVELAGGLDPLHPLHPRRQLGVAPLARTRAEMLAHPRAQTLRAPDEECRVARARRRWLGLGVEKIEPGGVGQGLEHAFGQAGRLRRRLHRACGCARQHLGREAGLQPAHELPQHLDVAHRAVARGADEAVALDQRIQAMAVVFGVEGARQLDGAQHRRLELATDAGEGVADEAVVEARAVGDEDAALEQRGDRIGQHLEGGRLGHHGVGDAGDLLDQRRDGLAGRDQTLPARDDLAVLDAQDGDLGDAVAHRVRAGALDIDEGETTRQAHVGLTRCRRRACNGGTRRRGRSGRRREHSRVTPGASCRISC